MATVDSVQRVDVQSQPPGSGVTGELLGGVLVVALAVAPLLFGLPHDRVAGEALLPLLAWPLLGIAGLVVLDRRPRDRAGWACVLAAPLPCLLVGFAALARGEATTTGSIEAFAAAAHALGPWTLLVLLVPVAATAGRTARAPVGRSERRWRWWVSLVAVVTASAGVAAWTLVSPGAYGAVAALGIGGLAAVVITSTVGRPPRPVVEPALDAALVLLVALTGAAVGALVHAFARAERIVAPEVIGGLAGAAMLALAAPTAVWVRREAARSRYGSGTMSPDVVAALSEGLGRSTDPRALLQRAAAVVGGLPGVTEARLVLDATTSPGWEAFSLRVAGDQVGTLLVRPADREGLEERQEQALRQLVPTLALATRAVALAVDAEHARQDAVRQREQERARILADLHDDLGPVLVGMGMRVEALRSARPSAELDQLGSDLAGCRRDLRRIVSDLSPSVLDELDLPAAIARLVDSFARGDGPQVRSRGRVPADVDAATASVVYRIVAEALTNAVRHAQPTAVDVLVRREDDAIRVEVRDDGNGAPIVPGTGLTSVVSRATQLGGDVRLTSRPGAGTTVSARLPETAR